MIWIGVTKSGRLLTSKHKVSEAHKKGTLAAWDEIYVSQLVHRCAAKIDGQWRLISPSEVQETPNIKKLKYFPPLEEFDSIERPPKEFKYDSRKLKRVKPNK
jgi:hypothetical protein